MVTIRNQLVTGANRAVNSGTNPGTYITVHQTGNTAPTAGAQNNADYQSSGGAKKAGTSWHITVDDKEAIRSYENTARCWHAGAGSGNNSSVGVELCINQGSNYEQTLLNGAEVVATLMKQLGVPLSKVVQHNYWSGKNCPTQIRAGKNGWTWAKFKELVQAAYDGTTATSPPSGGNLTVDGVWGSATTKRLQQVLGTTADGVVSGQDPDNKLAPLTTGWEWKYQAAGSNVIRALQRKLGVTVDGHFGAKTATALAKQYGLVSDGKFDNPSATIKALQAALNKGVV